MTSPTQTHPRRPPDVAPVLEVRGLSVTFTTESGTVSAVDNVDLTLGQGEIVGIVGESGCGKSVTAMSLAGLLPRTATVTSTEPTRLWRISGDDFLAALTETSLSASATAGLTMRLKRTHPSRQVTLPEQAVGSPQDVRPTESVG